MFKQIIATAILVVGFLMNLLAQSEIEQAIYNNQFETALHLIDQKSATIPLDQNDYIMAARCHVALFNFEMAINSYQIALALNQQNLMALEGLADASINLGLKENALINYNDMLAIDSLNIRVLGKKAALLSDLNQYSEAETIYRFLLGKNNQNPYFYRRMLMAMYKQKKTLEIISEHENRPNYTANDKEVNMMYADSYYKVGDYKLTLQITAEILQIDSLYTPALSKAGYIHFTIYRNYEDAVVFYRTLMRTNKYSDPVYLKNLAICEYFTGNQEFAAPVLDSLITELADDPIVPFYAGLSYRKLGNIDRALELLEYATEMLSMPPYTSDFYHHLGRAYNAKRMYTEALEAYQMVLKYDDKNVQILYDMAIIHEEYNRNSSVALVFYQQFLNANNGRSTPDVKYAENRVKRIKEELFLE